MAKQPSPQQWSHKIRPVRVSEMRVPPVEVAQRRFNKAQASEYAANFDPNKFGVPSVNHRGGIYWIVDGQHRIEALKQWFGEGADPGTIDCNVYVDLTDAEMADLFIGLNTRRSVNAYDMFQCACTAGYKREASIRRIVEAQGLKISRTKEPNCVSSISAIGRVYDRAGDIVLGQTVRTIKNAFAGDPSAFEGCLVEGIAGVFNRFNGRTSEKDLAARLASTPHGHRGVLQRAEAKRERTGNSKAQCVSAVVVDIYNKGTGPRASNRLPAWWKESD